MSKATQNHLAIEAIERAIDIEENARQLTIATYNQMPSQYLVEFEKIHTAKILQLSQTLKELRGW